MAKSNKEIVRPIPKRTKLNKKQRQRLLKKSNAKRSLFR
jgi:hypothetical protein